MPTARYLIRNEYGLSDPDLYQLADKDDPEAVLEGVAMAGLVGVLRQLGDLAEFAAKIFHDLHEEVTSTGARGHGLMLRVQQLEAEFPSIEKGLLVQSSHSQFAYNDGMDWHTNLRTDQNLITQGDMPRFILDSYEESRGPPRLFMLDKFDVAGAGACLKRYSDPSFFKVDYASTGKMEEEMHTEIKHTKIKKKAHWKKGESIESFLAPLINSNLQPDQVSAKVPFRRVKLKCRKLLDSDIASKKSYMEQFLEACSTEEKVWPQNFASHPPEIIKSIDSAQFSTETHGTIVKNINDSSTVRKISPSQSPKRKEKTLDNSKFMNEPEIESKGSLKYYAIEDEYSSDEGKKSVTENIQVNMNKSLANSNSSPDHEYGEPDDIGSDLENYVDALNTIESEVERDTKNKIMPHQNLELVTTDSITWDQKQHTETSPSKERDSMIEMERSPSNSDMSNDPTDTQDFSKPEMPNITFNEVLANDKVEEFTLSNHLLLNWGSMYETDMTSKDHSNIEVERSPSNSDISNDPTDNQKYLKPEMPDKTDNEVLGNDKVNDHALSNRLLLNWISTNETVIASKDNCNVEDQCSIEDTLVSRDCKVAEPSSFSNNTTNFNESIPLSEAKEAYTARDRSPESVGDDDYVEGRVFNHILQTMYQNNNENIHVQLLGESAFETIESSLGRVSLSDSGNDDEYLEGKDFDHISETTYPNYNVDIHVQPLEGSTADRVKETQHSVNGIEWPISLACASNDDMWKPREVSHTDDAVSTEPVKDSSNLSDNLLLLPDIHGSHLIKDVEATISSDTEMKEENVYEDVLNDHIEDSNVQQNNLPDTREQNNKTCVDANTHDRIFTVVEGNAVAVKNDNIGVTYNDMAEDVIKAIKPDINIDGTKEFNDELLPEILMISTDKLHPPLTISSENDRHNNNSIDDVNPFESEKFSYAEGQIESLEANLGPVDLLDSANFIFSGEMQLHNELSNCIVDSGPENQKENMPMEFPIEEPLDGLQDEKPSIVTSTDAEILEDQLPTDNVNMEFQNDMQVGSDDGLVVTSNEAEDPKESPHENSTEQLPFYSRSRISEEEYQSKDLSCTLIGENKSDSGTSDLAGCKLVKQADNDSLDEYVIVDSDENNRSTHSDENNLSTHSDENNRSTHLEYSVDDARFEIKLEENYMPCDAVLSRHCTEDEESCNPNNLDPLNMCEPQPSIISNDESPVENLISPDNSPTEPDNGNENLICSTENEQDFSLEKLENQENNHFVVLDRQLERACMGSNNLTVCQNVMEQLSKPEYSEYFEVDNIRSDLELSTYETPGLPSTLNSSLQDSDEIPPLPPLPPIEWIGNFRLVPQSLTNDTIQHTVNDTIQPTDATDSIIEQTMSDEKHYQANDVDKKINFQFSKEDLDASSSSIPEVTHVDDLTIKHGQHKRPQLAQLLPTFKLEISQHEASSSAGDPVMPVNPYFVGPCTEEWRHQYGYGFYGSESVQNLNLPPYGFLYPIGGDASAVYNYMIPTIDGENLNLKYRSIRDRPRDPLIEAVAAHDKSKLRKVSELDLPSTKPKEDDRNPLLEEIKNKSFNLKPANAIKPNFKGVPPANLKVSAILEKANAIRKACAESDEDDCDSWSDS